MNFNISKKLLCDVMKNISQLLANTVILPIYHGVKIVAAKEGLTITVADGTVSMIEFVNTDIKIYEFGECVVDGKLFHQIIKKTGDHMIWIRTEGSYLKVKAGKAEMKLIMYQEGAYPEIDFSYPKSKIQIDAVLINDAIKKTINSASDQQTRPVLGGLNFEIKDNLCKITGTDSYRLSQVAIPVVSENDISITIPKKLLLLLSDMFIENEVLQLYLDDNKVLIANDAVIIQSVLLAGIYPKTESVIPKSFQSMIKIKSELLLDALDRTDFCKSEGITIVSFELLNDEICISSDSKEIGSSIEAIPFTSVSGEKDVKFCCNQRYIMEAVKAMKTAECVLNFNSDREPFIITSENDPNHIQLLLPVRHL